LEEPGQYYAVYNICRVWSFWDARIASRYVRVLRMLWSLGRRSFAGKAVSEQAVISRYAEVHGEDHAQTAFRDMVTDHMSLGGTSSWSRTENRGFFAALLCFCPGGLTAEYS